MMQFNYCYLSCNTKVNVESVHVDAKSTEEFLETLDKLIVEQNYLPEQIFSMNEISPFWKQMPERTFICQQATAKSLVI